MRVPIWKELFCQLKLGEFALHCRISGMGYSIPQKEGKILWAFGKWGFHLGEDDKEYIEHFEEILKIR
ncbi:hypothetical protein MASR2M39_06440 [Ignavibacteriales bacterium]